jgi:hypothetical protein
VFRPRLKDLVQMNTPRVVMQETKKAFRHIHKQTLEAAVAAMSNLKGVGPAMASGNSTPSASAHKTNRWEGRRQQGQNLYSVGTPTCALVRCLCCGAGEQKALIGVQGFFYS